MSDDLGKIFGKIIANVITKQMPTITEGAMNFLINHCREMYVKGMVTPQQLDAIGTLLELAGKEIKKIPQVKPDIRMVDERGGEENEEE